MSDKTAPSDIKATPGKTEVWVDGMLVADITDGHVPGRDELIPYAPTQAEVDEERERNEIASKLQASRANSSKKEVQRKAR